MKKRTTETPKGQRIAEIYAHLVRNKTRRYSVEDMAVFLENSGGPMDRRNVQRDLKLIYETSGTCVTRERVGGRLEYFIEPDMRGKINLPIQRNGLLAFFLLKRLQPFFAPKTKTLDELSEAITDHVSETDYDLFEDLDEDLESSTFSFGESSPLALDGEMFNDLLTSLVKHRKLKLMYQKGGDKHPEEKTVCPAKLVLFKNELYFICMSEYNGHDFFIKLCRILKAELLPETFEVDAKRIRKIEERLRTSFGIFDGNVPKPQKVVVRFPKDPYYQHIFTEKKFHGSQKVSTDKAGNVLVTMNVPVGLDLINWVLSWPDSVVQEPQELVKEMLVVAETLRKKYGKR